MTKVAIVAGTENRLLDCLIEELKKKEVNIIRLQQPNLHNISKILILPRLVYLGLLDSLRLASSKPDVVAYHFFGPRSLFSSIWLALFHVPYVIHFWGSDYHYWRKNNNFLLRLICRQAQSITFANTQLKNDAEKLLGPNIKFRILRFGLEAIDLIDSNQKTFDSESVKVVIGTNAHPGQQHIEIINALTHIQDLRTKDFIYVFPLNYGDEDNKKVVKEKLGKSNLSHEIIEQYLLGQDLAEFRKKTTVLVQLQKTDAMSGAMLESLYAGAKVITGAWLPYDDLRSRGINWVEIDNIYDITNILPKINEIEVNFIKNKEIVASIARWSDLIPEWLDCYINQ